MIEIDFSTYSDKDLDLLIEHLSLTNRDTAYSSFAKPVVQRVLGEAQAEKGKRERNKVDCFINRQIVFNVWEWNGKKFDTNDAGGLQARGLVKGTEGENLVVLLHTIAVDSVARVKLFKPQEGQSPEVLVHYKDAR